VSGEGVVGLFSLNLLLDGFSLSVVNVSR